MSLNDYLPECAICYEPLNANLVTSTSCGHVFHACCLDKWITNDNICPICRRVIKAKIKILFDFKQSPSVRRLPSNQDGETDFLQQTINENLKLSKENKLLTDEKTELEKSFISLNEKFIQFANQFSEVNQTVKEYKNRIIGLTYRLEEVETERQKLSEAINEKDKLIRELQEAKKDLEEKIGNNREVVDLLIKMDDTEKEFNLRDTVSDFLKKNDGVTSLTTFIFVLHQKIKNYEDQIENLKKQKLNPKKDSFIEKINDKAFLALINENNSSNNSIFTDNNNLARKRKFAEMSAQPDINHKVISPIKTTLNANTNIISISDKSVPAVNKPSIIISTNPFINKNPPVNNINNNKIQTGNNININISNLSNNSFLPKNSLLIRHPYQLKDSFLKK